PREKVLAMVVALMDHTLLRVGNETYRQQNRSYGLTTLRNHHIRFLAGGRAHIAFRGKAGQPQEAVIDDRRLARLVRRCRELPGQCLFQYRDDDGNVQPVQSNQVNDYLQEVMGEAFTAKDFRTWGGTVAAMRALAGLGEAAKVERECAAQQVQGGREVAALRGHTPAVCRQAYIDPPVLHGSAARPISTPASSPAGARAPCSASAATAEATDSGSRPRWSSCAGRVSAPLPRPARFPRSDCRRCDGFQQTTSGLPGHGDSDGPL